jgi:hypothetical protein
LGVPVWNIITRTFIVYLTLLIGLRLAGKREIGQITVIPWFIMPSRRTRRIIMENLGWAFAYNLIAVPLAAFGVISPVITAATMATSNLLVVGNSLRLRR